MSKRKKTVPTRADEEKRRCLTWNMLDNVSSSNQGSLSVCLDDDPSIIEEFHNASQASKQHAPSSLSLQATPNNTDELVQDKTVLDSYLENCLFCITIQKELNLKPQEWKKQLESFSLTFATDDLGFSLSLENCTQPFWLYVGQDGCDSFLYAEDDHQKFKFWCIKADLPLKVLEAFQEEKIFQLVINSYEQSTQSVLVDVYLRQAALVNLKFACEPIKIKKHSSAIQNVISHFFNVEHFEYTGELTKNQDIEELYLAVKNRHSKLKTVSGCEEKLEEIHHPNLIPLLRPYQREAVRWMINQELNINTSSGLHKLYKTIKLSDGTELYYNRLVGSLTLRKFEATQRLPGGILADEMGLGKTVEVLACMILHPRTDMVDKTVEKNNLSNSTENIPVLPDNDNCGLWNGVGPKDFFECICGAQQSTCTTNNMNRNIIQCVKCTLWQHGECVNYKTDDPSRPDYYCPHCLVRNTPVKSGATLIISPSSICYQWVDEILKHIRDQSLKVFVYTGVHKQGFIQPHTLAGQDIVITTYETLRKELDYVDLPHSNSESGRKFRHPKRFMAIPSPMTAVEWWRICLDEAQMVESTSAKTATMALKLTAVNRWCVTGTPIQRSVEDLYGLFLFLGIDPFWVKQWFDELLCTPLYHGNPKPIYDAVASVLWRTSKKDVIDQINIPAQKEYVHWLTFSPVEDHFYRRQYHDCVKDCMKKLSRWTDRSTKLSSLDKQTTSQLLAPLLRLRQACCHPQAVRGEFLPLQKSTMTMEELLESLTKKARTECEEAHRQIIAALNGQAGIHIINDQYIEAVDKYREVLRSVEEHKEQLRTDELQQLHALHNLQEMIGIKPEGLQPTLRDSQLVDQANDIRNRYMTKAETKVTVAQQHLKPLQDNVNQLKNEFVDGSEWWLEAIDLAVSRQIEEDLVQHIKSELSDNAGDLGPHISIANMFHDIRGLELVLEQKLQALESSHNKLIIALNELSHGLTASIINTTVECCLRPVGEILKNCSFCTIDKLFQDYESKLYSFTEQGLVLSGDQFQAGTRRQGTWADSQLEKSMKAIISFAKQCRFDRDVIEYGLIHIKIFEGMKKEFKGLRSVWMALREQVSSIDELEMATTRLRLRLPDEPESTTTQLNIIDLATIDQHVQKLKSDQIVGKCELRKKLGQLLYLTNLAKAQNENKDGHNPESCPICQKELGVEWSVMHCGHCYCLDCINILLDQYSFGGRNRVVKCAVCREKTYRSDVSYVSTKKSQDSDDMEGYNVKGSHSTKVGGVIKQMLKIHQNDPTAKILVFSTWVDVLNVLATALTENNINYRTLYHGVKFQQNLTAFREDKDVLALLLPIQSGSNGLNLIEATYVLLVEPILNPAQELQAIGRVHRIGQTKKTEVHRFLVRGTIEQKMYLMLKTLESSPSSHDTEENPLTIGDLTSLLSEESRNQDQVEDALEVESQNEQETARPNISGEQAENLNVDNDSLLIP